jgi:hypothetical protein
MSRVGRSLVASGIVVVRGANQSHLDSWQVSEVRVAAGQSGRTELKSWYRYRSAMHWLAAYSSCLLGMFVASLFFSVAMTHAASFTWQDGECWQTGEFGAESDSCEKVTAAGYLATHTIDNQNGVEDLKLTKSGQYCSYSGLDDIFGKEETGWFEVPSPVGSYQEGDGKENVCAVWAPTKEVVRWGLQLNNNPGGKYAGRKGFECKEIDPSERCGVEHYFSLAGQGLNDRPWASYFSYPTLTLSDPGFQNLLQAFQPGEIGEGWGKLCPVLEDSKSGNILEVCFVEWLGYGIQTKASVFGSLDYDVAQCRNASGSFSHNYDKIVKKLKSGEPEETREIFDVLTDEPPKESAFPSETRFKAQLGPTSLGSTAMQEIAELDNQSFKSTEKSGGFSNEPELGYGCGRSSSVNPSEWALIGVENGIEEWETNKEPQTGREKTGWERAVEEPVWVRTEFVPHETEITAETASKISETEATVTGNVNPYGVETDYVIEYGTGDVGEHATTATPIGNGITGVPISTTLTSLNASITYKYRIQAYRPHEGYTRYGPEQTFSTLGKPSVETKLATGVNKTSATLDGAVNPRGTETKYYFEYGLEKEKYEHKTTEASAGSGTSNVEEGKVVTGLEPITTYHFRIVATNGKGTTDGKDQTFTTAEPSWLLQESINPSGVSKSVLSGVSCTTSEACTAVGYYKSGSSGLSTLAERWNGTSWSQQSSPTPKNTESRLLEVSCASSTTCMAVGLSVPSSGGSAVPLAEEWNGTKGEWSTKETPLPTGAIEGRLFGISCASETACTAVGEYGTSTGEAKTLGETWLPSKYGEKWIITSETQKETVNETGSDDNVLNGVSCTEWKTCNAVGYYRNKEGSPVALAEVMGDGEWHLKSLPLPSGTTSSYLSSVWCAPESECTAVGEYETEASKGLSMTLVEHWKGSERSIQASPNPVGGAEVVLSGISCTSATACIATGSYENSSDIGVTLSERLSGTEWLMQTTSNPTGSNGSFLNGVSCTSLRNCIAVGEYLNSSDILVTLAEAY